MPWLCILIDCSIYFNLCSNPCRKTFRFKWFLYQRKFSRLKYQDESHLRYRKSFSIFIAWSTKILVRADIYLYLSRLKSRRLLLHSNLWSLLGRQNFTNFTLEHRDSYIEIQLIPKNYYFIAILIIARSTKAFTTGRQFDLLVGRENLTHLSSSRISTSHAVQSTAIKSKPIGDIRQICRNELVNLSIISQYMF